MLLVLVGSCLILFNVDGHLVVILVAPRGLVPPRTPVALCAVA